MGFESHSERLSLLIHLHPFSSSGGKCIPSVPTSSNPYPLLGTSSCDPISFAGMFSTSFQTPSPKLLDGTNEVLSFHLR